MHALPVKSGFKIRKETLAKDVEQFLNKKVSEGFEVVNVSSINGINSIYYIK
ncbi:hypothetical protein [Flavobacterium sp.]|uniref:hypothetical protein n=1 Tax=Flavobacterium sp. TaxID=239 RepID=UPI002A81B232|nr:hypothetical protein [Flavobacterium sp.]